MSFIPAYPRIDATIRENLTGELTINGTSLPLVAADLARLRAGVIARCAATARQVHRPIRVHVIDIAGTYALVIHPDAYVQILDATGTAPDLAAGAARPGQQLAVPQNKCPSCQVENPHDVQAAPASAVLHGGAQNTAPITAAERDE